MKILLLDIPLFREQFRRLGHEVCSLGPDPACETVIRADRWSLESIRAERPVGFEPDLVLLSESLKQRHLPLDLARLPWPSVWYSIDGHLHLDWHLQMGRLVDRVLCSQLAVCRAFLSRGLRADWLPWSVDAPSVLPAERDLALTMVGSFHPGHRPRRMQLLERLRRRFPLSLYGPPVTHFLSPGEQEVVYGRSRIVFNESIGGEINFRLLEAAACGACVFSDHADNGQDLLLQPGEEFVAWRTETFEEQLEELLADPARCALIGERARRRVLADHGRLARARQLLETLSGTGLREGRQAEGSRGIEQALRSRLFANGIGPAATGPDARPAFHGPEDLLPSLEWLRGGGDPEELRGVHPALDLAIHADQLLRDIDAGTLCDTEARTAGRMLCDAFASAGRLRAPGMWRGPADRMRYPAWELQLIEALAHRMPGEGEWILRHARCLLDSGQPEAALDSLISLLRLALGQGQSLPVPLLHEIVVLQNRCGFREQALLSLLSLAREDLRELPADPLVEEARRLCAAGLEELRETCRRQPDSAALEILLRIAAEEGRKALGDAALARARAFAPRCPRLRRLEEDWNTTSDGAGSRRDAQREMSCDATT